MTKPFWLRDVIECSTMDARPPVKLRAATTVPLDFAATDVVFILPRCSVCRIRDADVRHAIYSDPAHVTCGEKSCFHAAQARKRAANAHVEGRLEAKHRRRT